MDEHTGTPRSPEDEPRTPEASDLTPQTEETAPAGETKKASGGRKTALLVGAVVVTALVTFGATALLMNILERQTEARVPYMQVVELDSTTVDPAIWGQNFPVHYEAYLATAEMNPTTHGGSVATPHTPTATDPRTIVSASRLEEDPRLITMWDGYPFSVDYRHARGHAYMLEDQVYTLRTTEFNQPGTCLNCHASTVAIFDELGNGDQVAGFHAMNALPYEEAAEYADHPVACIDCHDPETMELVITRPAFVEGIADYMASQGIENYNVNEDATAQEMRSFVCGQCHVEYYFDGDAKTLTFPWSNGITVEEIYEYYMEDGHIDFTHATAGTEIIKAQHPEFDIWTQGIHGRAGVSCTDCHMPYQSVGSAKVTNHQIQSPLLNVNASCGTCHNENEEDLTARVLTIQDSFIGTRDKAMDALVMLITHLETALTDGTPSEYVTLAQQYHQQAQFYIDYVYSENSYGFHADQYMSEILADSLDLIRKGELALTGVPQDELEWSMLTAAGAPAKTDS